MLKHRKHEDARRARPQRRKTCIFYKLNVKENGDVTSTPHKEEFDKQNYESVEEWETTL